MIRLFWNNSSYLITGDGVEIIKKVTPPGDVSEHIVLYAVLTEALKEIIALDTKEDLVAYNNTRLIDEIRGETSCLDEQSRQLRNSIIRNVLPRIKSFIIFKKKDVNFITSNIEKFSAKLLREPVFLDTEKNIDQSALLLKQKALERFKNGTSN